MDGSVSWPALPAELGIYAAAALRDGWLAQLAALPGGGTVEVDGSGVEQIDGAGAQLLLALAHALQARGASLQVARPSPALAEGCRVLGLRELLETVR